ncbi:cobalt-precorrin-6A reductase [Neorhizobium sp. T786]|uniref:cobalt-precorrin-6A reductase n=1 Tax=Pseudorhizobium xiangyangii TaxID=2883104 RepID=UPI001CFFACD5|nr:cobalt-precorrin-6A reductase [Neorhizobium xiangyangii]MCB5203456.1 cobalt-precorrin-6A reductase [Neorhizobium xiangyangii]
MKHSILILGGTAESRQLAERMAKDIRYAVELSLAGRTRSPVEQPVPVWIGGFGGAEGLADHLRQRDVKLMIDATHPYAARMSRNAVEAARLADIPLIALRRAPWKRQEGDLWHDVGGVPQAVSALGDSPRRVFLTLGRQELLPFEAAPQHDYLIRSVDPIEPALELPQARYLTSRGPFVEADEMALLQQNKIEVIVAKNSGGPASYGKIAAARALGIEVVLIQRPELPEVASVDSVEEALSRIDHILPPL